MLEELEEPAETDEVRLPITVDNFQQTAAEVIEAFEEWIPSIPEWEIDKPSYEGVRIKVMDGSEQTGWMLLRASLHDPLLVVNAESDEDGGMTHSVLCICACSCAVPNKVTVDNSENQTPTSVNSRVVFAGVRAIISKLSDFFNTADLSGGSVADQIDLAKLNAKLSGN